MLNWNYSVGFLIAGVCAVQGYENLDEEETTSTYIFIILVVLVVKAIILTIVILYRKCCRKQPQMTFQSSTSMNRPLVGAEVTEQLASQHQVTQYRDVRVNPPPYPGIIYSGPPVWGQPATNHAILQAPGTSLPASKPSQELPINSVP